MKHTKLRASGDDSLLITMLLGHRITDEIDIYQTNQSAQAICYTLKK